LGDREITLIERYPVMIERDDGTFVEIAHRAAERRPEDFACAAAVPVAARMVGHTRTVRPS
jgi:hypothetical protein